MNSKLRDIIENGKKQVSKTMDEIMLEFQDRQDILAKTSKINFGFEEDKLRLNLAGKNFALTDWSAGQILNKAGIPAGYFETMKKAGKTELALSNLKTMVPALQDALLIRQVKSTVKGVLSPSYRRMDASPMFEAFISEMLKRNYFPYKAFNTDSQYQVRFLRPDILTIGNDDILIGFSISTSDYGARSFSIEVFVIRLVCQNGMIGMDVLRRKHIGRRAELEDEDYSIYTRKTITLENKSFQSKVTDILRNDNTVNLISSKVKESQNKEIKDTKAFLESVKELSKDEKNKCEVLFNSDTGVDLLPKGKSLWRMANVISLISKSEENQDRSINLESAAMNLLQR